MKIAGFLMALLGSLAIAQARATEPTYWLLAKYDMDGDAQISAEEVAAKRNRLFALMDDDEDSVVSFEEYQYTDQARRRALLQARFNKLDRDLNGEVSRSEYASFMGLFNNIDSDGNGLLSQEEMVAPAQANQASVPHCLLWLCVRSQLD